MHEVRMRLRQNVGRPPRVARLYVSNVSCSQRIRAVRSVHCALHQFITMRPNNPTTARTRKVLRNVIQAYRGMPHLWDKKHKDYFNKQLRNQDFKKLTAIYQQAEADATIYTVRRKIDNLRNVYLRELKKVKASQLTAADPQDVYEPSLWHYQNMSFLENVMEPQLSQSVTDEGEKRLSTIEVKIEEDPLDSDSNEQYIEYDDMEDDGDTSSYSHLQPSTSSMVKETSADDNKDAIIGKSIGVQLKDVQKKQKVIALKLISDAIYYANLGKLTETSFIQLQ